MASVRVGIVGLASVKASDGLGQGSWGVISHLGPILESPHYDVVAVCNSSVESAKSAIEFHKLPSSVKAYGHPGALAADDDVDLVAVSVNVAKHFVLAAPALLKGKAVFVEWPLAASLKESEELVKLAKTADVKTAVGLQFRADPLISKVKSLISEGSIGRITSSVAWGCSSVLPADIWWDQATYYLDMKTGGNEFYIYFGHFLDTFTYVLGSFDLNTVQPTLATQTPTTTLVNAEGQVVDPAYPKTSPDHAFVQGKLTSGALASVDFRKTKKPVDGLGLRWIISGTEGEIEVTLPESHLQMSPEGRAIRLRNGSLNKAVNVDFEDPQESTHVKSVTGYGTNSARIYEAMVLESGRYATFESALETHKLLDKIAREARFL